MNKTRKNGHRSIGSQTKHTKIDSIGILKKRIVRSCMLKRVDYCPIALIKYHIFYYYINHLTFSIENYYY